MDTASYRKINPHIKPINVMRQFYYNYQHQVIKRTRTMESSQQIPKKQQNSIIKMTQIMNKLTPKGIMDSHTWKHGISTPKIHRNSYFFLKKSRKQMEECQDKIKGQFRNTFSNTNGFMHPNLGLKEKQNIIKKEKVYASTIQDFYPSSNILSPQKRRQQMKQLKKKMIQSQIQKQQQSSKIRYNYLLRKKHKIDEGYQKLRYQSIDKFYETKENIFPNSCKN